MNMAIRDNNTIQDGVFSETFTGKFVNIAKTVSINSLTVGVIYLTGYLNINPLWLLFPIIIFAMRNQSKAEKELIRMLKKNISIKDEKKLILSHFDRSLPSWVCFPDVERCEWFNTILSQIWPNVNVYATEMLKCKLEPRINEKLSAYMKESFKFSILSLGSVPPRISGIKVYGKNKNCKEIAMDLHIFYAGDCNFSFTFLGLTGGIQNFQIRGLMRIIMRPLTSSIPLFGGIDIFFIDRPNIEFNLVGIVDILNLPGLNGQIQKMLDDQIASSMVQPNKIHFSLNADLEKAYFSEIDGVLCVNVLEAKNLVNKDFSFSGQDKSDPYVILSVGDQTFKSSPIQNSLNPAWNFWSEFIIRDFYYGEVLKMKVMDKDEITADSHLGKVSVEIDLIKKTGEMDSWLQLEDTKCGMIHFVCFFFLLSSNPEDYKSGLSFFNTFPISSSLLEVYIDSFQISDSSLESKPDSSILVSVGNNVQSSKTITASFNPIFEEVFTYLIISPELEKLKIKWIDQNKKNAVLGHITFNIEQLLDCENLELSDKTFPLDDSISFSSVTLSLKLRILKKIHTNI